MTSLMGTDAEKRGSCISLKTPPLWCQVHKSREERTKGRELSKAVECIRALVEYHTGSKAEAEKCILSIPGKEIAYNRVLLAKVLPEGLYINTAALPGVSQENIDIAKAKFLELINAKEEKDAPME